MNKSLSVSVASAIKSLNAATSAGLKFSDVVREGVTTHGLSEFAAGMLDSLRGSSLMGEKAIRKAGTGEGSLFSKYTLAIRVLKSMAPEGWELKISAKEGAPTECTQAEKQEKAKPVKEADGAPAPTSAGEQDGQAGAARVANMSESLAKLLASAGDAAILEAFHLLEASSKGATSRVIAAAIAYGQQHAKIGEAAADQVASFRELLAHAG